MTSKLQLTVPKAIAVEYGIRPGDELDWEPAGDVIRVIPPRAEARQERSMSVEERLRLFDRATRRQQHRRVMDRKLRKGLRKGLQDRGWTREELYTRGRPR